AIQSRVAAFNTSHGDDAIIIKLGLHRGPCIAVTLNDRLDYFGSTVNLAARLQGQSVGGDIVLSQALAVDAGVQALLADYAVTDETAQIKGFDRPVAFHRLTAAALATGHEPAPAAASPATAAGPVFAQAPPASPVR
ncbi:MAG: adenylate/guanylate cyclase domain-containing protein, partial [Dongiaceae bacterium]